RASLDRNDDRLRSWPFARWRWAARWRGDQVGLAIAAAGENRLEPFLSEAFFLRGTGLGQSHRIATAVSSPTNEIAPEGFRLAGQRRNGGGRGGSQDDERGQHRREH